MFLMFRDDPWPLTFQPLMVKFWVCVEAVCVCVCVCQRAECCVLSPWWTHYRCTSLTNHWTLQTTAINWDFYWHCGTLQQFATQTDFVLHTLRPRILRIIRNFVISLIFKNLAIVWRNELKWTRAARCLLTTYEKSFS